MSEPTLAEAASMMLSELGESRLVVVKVGTLRVVQSRNPPWYRDLCSGYERRRKRYPAM